MDNQNPAVETSPSQVYTAPQPATPPPSPKSFLSNKIILTSIILLILLSLGGTYLALNSKPKSQPIPSPTLSSTPSPTNLPNNKQSSKIIVERPYEAFLKFVDRNFSNENYVRPVFIKIDSACFKYEGKDNSVFKQTVICDPLFEAITKDSKKIVLKPVRQEKVLTSTNFDYDVYLEFWENGQKLNIPIYKFPSYLWTNLLWFGLSVSFSDKDYIYVNDYSGHETDPTSYFFDGSSWNKLSLWEMVKPHYPKELIDLSNKGLPTFEIIVSDKNLKVVETKNAYYGFDRNIRYVFIFDKASRQYIKTETFPVNL